jgi:Cof subfamily protein (haloacid dehalogenase superfamily)
MPVVSLNGSYIFHNNQIIHRVDIALPQVISINNELKGIDVAAMYYSQMEWYAEVDRAEVKKEQKITDVPITIQPFEVTLATWEAKKGGPNKILIAGDKELIIEIEQKLLLLHQGELNIYKSQPRYLEVINPQASKTKAIEFLIDKFGILQTEVIAIGDNYNDVGMIEFAGIGVAMGNAPEEIKLSANYVTDTNNNDGVAKALAYFFK